MAGNDYIFARLTEAGLKLADGNPLRITGRTTIVFTPGETTRMARYEWDMTLGNYHSVDGARLFELAAGDESAAATGTTKEQETT